MVELIKNFTLKFYALKYHEGNLFAIFSRVDSERGSLILFFDGTAAAYCVNRINQAIIVS